MLVGNTKVETWTTQELVNAILDNSNINKIIIPKFQRNLVWSSKQKKSFIDSIKKGFPIGAFLLSNIGSEGKITMYSLIDGLQRATTLKEYIGAPTSKLFFDYTNIDSDLLEETITSINIEGLEVDTLSITIANWVTSLKGFDDNEHRFSAYDLARYIKINLDLKIDENEFDDFVNKFRPVVSEVKKDADITSFEIPLLVYNGPEEHLPDIFERLNSKGTQLSKYQIYAAAWNDKTFTISNKKIVKKIQEKYKSLVDDGYEVDNYDPENFNDSEFSCFEYIFGFGKLLSEKHPLLFSKKSKKEKEDSIGFNIVNICLGKQFSDMKTLPKDFFKHKTDELEICILDAIDFVNDSLKTQLALKMNGTKKTNIVHTDMQIVSIIGKVFHSKYDSDLGLKSNWNKKKEGLEENLKFHYLFDILKESWKGSGDTKAYNLIYNEHYEKSIDKRQWESLFGDWLANDLQKKEMKRVAIQPKSILFLQYIYVRVLLVEHQTGDKGFEIEHLVPVDRLKDLATTSEIGLPISAFPNLCLLNKKINRKKAKNTFYEYYKKEVANKKYTSDESEDLIKGVEDYSFTKQDDLLFVEEKHSFTPEAYEKFLKKRFNLIIEKFYSLYKIKKL